MRFDSIGMDNKISQTKPPKKKEKLDNPKEF
jgi:hypothetical protein